MPARSPRRALFRAPAPGTTGLVGLDAIRRGRARCGLVDFDRNGLIEVRVARAATLVDAAHAQPADRRRPAAPRPPRRRHRGGSTVRPAASSSFNAEAVADPVDADQPALQPGSRHLRRPLHRSPASTCRSTSTARIDLMIEAPHLASSLQAGSRADAADIEMKKVPLDYADSHRHRNHGPAGRQGSSRRNAPRRPDAEAQPMSPSRWWSRAMPMVTVLSHVRPDDPHRRRPGPDRRQRRPAGADAQHR